MSQSTPAQNIQEQVQNRFSDVAANYRTSAVHAAGADLDLLVASLSLTDGSRVLDAGCGAGHTALAIAASAAQVVALDFTPVYARPSAGAHNRARRPTTCKRCLAMSSACPSPPPAFDAIVSRYSAHHWSAPQRALAEFRRALKPGGCRLDQRHHGA